VDMSVLEPELSYGALFALDAGSALQPTSEVDDLGQVELTAWRCEIIGRVRRALGLEPGGRSSLPSPLAGEGEIERSEMAPWNSLSLSRYVALRSRRATPYVSHDLSHLAPLDLPSSGPSGHLPPQGGKGFAAYWDQDSD